MTARPNSVKATQARLLENALNWGEVWTSADLKIIADCPEIPAAELAEYFDRTLYSIENCRLHLEARTTEARARKPRGRVERTYTFIDGDVPEGW